MKKLTFILFSVIISLTSCSSDDETTQAEDEATMARIRQELTTMSKINSEACTNPEEWDFAVFINMCNIEEYLIYSKKADKKAFLKKVNSYNKSIANYKKKWGTTCETIIFANSENMSIPVKPSGIQCSEGKPILKYNATN